MLGHIEGTKQHIENWKGASEVRDAQRNPCIGLSRLKRRECPDGADQAKPGLRVRDDSL
jgi:hypothetical protein